MCISVIAIDQNEEFPLIILHNRDESREREATPLSISDDSSSAYGVDLKGGGTWIGINSDASVAFVTNQRTMEPFDDKKTSRGGLVKRFLDENISPEEFRNTLFYSSQFFNPYNIVFGDRESLFHFNSKSLSFIQLTRGVHTVSNASLNSGWYKEKKLKENFKAALDKKQKPTELFELMLDEELAQDSDIPDTYLGHETEKKLSSIFVNQPNFGTLVTTLVTRDRSGNVRIIERTHSNPPKEVVHHFP